MYCKRVARNDVLGLGPAVLGAENLVSTQWFGQLGGFYVALLALLTLKMWDHVETVRIYNQKKISSQLYHLIRESVDIHGSIVVNISKWFLNAFSGPFTVLFS